MNSEILDDLQGTCLEAEPGISLPDELIENDSTQQISTQSVLVESNSENSTQINSINKNEQAEHINQTNSNQENQADLSNKSIDPIIIDNSITTVDTNQDHFIDLTKENDDLIIIKSTRKSRTRNSKIAIRSFNSNHLNASSEVNNELNDSDLPIIIHEVNIPSNDNSNGAISASSSSIRSVSKKHKSHNDKCPNSTIIIDDETSETTSKVRKPISHYQSSTNSNSNSEFIFPSFNLARNDTELSALSSIASIARPIGSIVNSTLNYSSNLDNSQNFINSTENASSSSLAGKEPKLTSYSNFKSKEKQNQSAKPSKVESQCPICLESFEEIKQNNKQLMATFCGHVLCKSCLDAHFKTNSSNKTINCPSCRTKLTKSKVHNLFL